MIKLICAYFSWVAIFAFVNAKKNDLRFCDEFKRILIKNLLFVQDLLKKLTEEKETQEKKEGNIAERMYTDAKKLNDCVEAMIDYRYEGNHGWEYETLNYMYCLTHQLPVIIKIRVFNNMIVRANVIIKNMKVVDIVDVKSGKVVSTAQAINFAMPDAEPSMNDAAVSKSEETFSREKKERMKSPESSDSFTEPGETPKEEILPVTETDNQEADELDEKRAKMIADNYLTDNYAQLDALANEAIADGSDNFCFTPDVESEYVLKCMTSLIVKKLKYKSAELQGSSILVYVNMESPADDGNYDFEKKESTQANETENESGNVEDGTAEEITDKTYEENEAADDIPEELIPEEPSDIPV